MFHVCNKKLGAPAARVIMATLGAIILLAPLLSQAASIEESLQYVQASSDFVEVKEARGLKIDLRYASTNNFTGKNLYGKFNRAYLHREAGSKLNKAVQQLQNSHPGYSLIIYDALRPRSVQYILWNQVKGSPKETYVANPVTGSIHNYGLAVDISIADASGRQLDMGTPYDDFSAMSQPALESGYIKSGKLSAEHIANRRLLQTVMESAGFIQLPVEWWHYDALPRAEVRGKFRIVE